MLRPMRSMHSRGLRLVRALLILLVGWSPVAGTSAVAAGSDIVLREGLAIRVGGRPTRSAFHTDLIEAQVVAGTWSVPHAGTALTMADGTNRVWEAVVAEPDGNFKHAALRGGYVYLPYVSDTPRVMLLQAYGHSMVYVNGEPRTGDPYQNGSLSLPVQLRVGTNDFLFSVGRGALRVELAEPPKPVFVDLRDTTTPDVISGKPMDAWGAVLVVNATTQAIDGLTLTATSKGGRSTRTTVPPLLPLSTRKVGFRLQHSGRSQTNQVTFTVQLSGLQRARVPLDSASLSLRVRGTDQTRRETFVSEQDGSVQYFGVNPAKPLGRHSEAPALILSAHGAGVEAQGQAEAYAPKTWAHVVTPTNRRAYGFDWEDWGRRDAMEVLAIARQRLGTDPRRTYLTGHSMGGHGTWQLGATFPDQFAAIAPSAGWISFFTYAGGRRYEGTNALAQLIQRAATPSDTLVLASNFLHHGIYILHGDADDNVPVSEARTMRSVLEKFHRDLAWHEQPGAGHWWGNACVDWPPLFDLFARHQIPSDESLRAVHFTTANPGISSASHWVSIEAQLHDLRPSTLDAHWDPSARRFAALTENVARLAFRLAHVPPGPAPTVVLDGQSLTNLTVRAGDARIWFARVDAAWCQVEPPSLAWKGPHRYGPFKEAFQHRMMFVYGTCGTPEENAWAFAKARFDAESFRYRGNASVDVVPDTAFLPAREPDRSVILYGHAESNSAWDALLGGSPVQVRRGEVVVGSRELRAHDLAALFLRPRPGSDRASVGVVTGTGPAGMRLTDRVPYFLAGVAFPDCTVFGPDTLEVGAAGARVTGFFGPDWSVPGGEFVWRD